MKCNNCKHGTIEEELLDDKTYIIIFCEHEKFILPERVVDGLDIYLDTLPDNWAPNMCPLEEVK